MGRGGQSALGPAGENWAVILFDSGEKIIKEALPNAGPPELRARPGERNRGGGARNLRPADGEGPPLPGEQRPELPVPGRPGEPGLQPSPAGLPGTPLPSCPVPPPSPDILAFPPSAPLSRAPAPGAQRGCPARRCPVGSLRPAGAEPGGRGEPGQRSPGAAASALRFLFAD